MPLFHRFLAVATVIMGVLTLAIAIEYTDRTRVLRQHGDTLADSLARNVAQLDQGSGTTVSEQVHRQAIPGNDGVVIPGGTLGASYFHHNYDPEAKRAAKVELALAAAERQVRDIREQRDQLAQSLATIAAQLGQEQPAAQFANLAKSTEATASLESHVAALSQRDAHLIDSLEQLARTVDAGDGLAFASVDQHQDALAALQRAATVRNQRLATFTDALVELPKRFEHHAFVVDADALAGEHYAQALVTLRNDIDEVDRKLARAKKQSLALLEAEVRVAQIEEQLDMNTDLIQQQEDELRTVTAHRDVLQERLVALGAGEEKDPSMIGSRRGKVVSINPDQHFVIVNLGAKHDVQPAMEMTVGREKEFICKVQVTRVYAEHSVCEVLPNMRKGHALMGDRVFF